MEVEANFAEVVDGVTTDTERFILIVGAGDEVGVKTDNFEGNKYFPFSQASLLDVDLGVANTERSV